MSGPDLRPAKIDNMAAKNESKEKIMEAALSLFERYGYEKTTIEEIARSIGKAKTAVYYYYDGKQDILREAVRRELGSVRDELSLYRARNTEKEPFCFRSYLKERMRLMISLRVYPQFTISQYSETANDACEAVRQVREEFDAWEREYFLSVCEKGKKIGVFNDAVNPEAFADMLLMLLKGVETQFFISKDKGPIVSTYNEMVDYLINGHCVECE